MQAVFLIENRSGEISLLELGGRDAWALKELVDAGAAGCTPITHPGPRWSGYVHRLRHKHGLDIETVHEAHKGRFPGTHARYVLRSKVDVLADESEAA